MEDVDQDPPQEDVFFKATIETERLGPELFRAILVVTLSQDGEEKVLRMALAGEHPTPTEAEFAAKLAIAAMGALPDAE